MKPRYAKPFARDLSGYCSMLASGQWEGQPPGLPGGPPVPGSAGQGGGDSLTGQCTVGERPYYACNVGTGFVGACTTGTLPDTSACNAGGFHQIPACSEGRSAATICISGANQNF